MNGICERSANQSVRLAWFARTLFVFMTSITSQVPSAQPSASSTGWDGSNSHASSQPSQTDPTV
jgi:hypothetical protein